MDFEEYRRRDATSLAACVADGEVTARELLALAQARADDVNPAVNAVVARMDAAAQERAAQAPAGSFGGVPFLLKDIAMEYAGEVSSYGSRALSREVADRHALVTQRFLDAGLVIFGRTNVPELGVSGVTESALWGPARNPWDLARTPGGSSGGAAAAVAAGIVPAAAANDGAGSIRIPAACCGLIGLKLSRGLSPHGPQTGEVMNGALAQGVVSRTVRDTAGLCDALIGDHPHATYSARLPQRPFVEALRMRAPRLRIAVATATRLTPSPDAAASAAVAQAAELLAGLGHHLDEVSLPYDDEQLAQDFLTIWFAHLYAQVREIRAKTGASPSDFEADTLAIVEMGRTTDVGRLLAAQAAIQQHVAAIAAHEERYDVLLTPTTARMPPLIGATRTGRLLALAGRAMAAGRAGRLAALTGVIDQVIHTNLAWVPYTQVANATGRPAISVPVFWTATGFPLGVQLLGRLGADAVLLQLAAELEEAAPWVHRLPRLDRCFSWRPGG